MPLSPPSQKGWRGVGEALAKRLAKLGIYRDEDLLLHLPLRYEDETRLTPVRDLRPGVAAQVEGLVVANEIVLRPRRQLIVRIQEGRAELTLRFLHFYPQQQKQMALGTRIRAFGETRPGFWGDEMVHPRIRVVTEQEALPTTLTPIYPTTAGLSQSALRKLIDRALNTYPFQESFPPAWRSTYHTLLTLETALQTLHRPPPETAQHTLENRTHPAWQRIKFEELLVQQITLRQAYLARREKNAPSLVATNMLTQQLLSRLPFTLTGAQQRAHAQIIQDLAQNHPMQRLLQGDVGSGKTIVAALAMLHTVAAGYQSALMAPTEILAEQHYAKLQSWFTPLGLEIAWITGSQKKSVRQTLMNRLAEGSLQLAVGTHALIEDPVAIPRLGLAVIDEQHRFGVRQRLALREKGSQSGQITPHILMMSATPIPRTLAMSYYADLDVSVLDELPPGRTPIQTKLVTQARRDEVIARIHHACRSGSQAYWVCPLIEESEALQLQTAQETFANLTTALPDLRIGLLHGRMKPDEKSAIMAEFAAGQCHVLVSTTVIEVGVDVPNATLMVIEHAERFGLAQLHQLRGRVGRGAKQSTCILLYAPPLSENGRVRLKTLFESHDGFVIAQTDLQLRGPGEFIGARQSGVPLLRYADLEADAELIEHVRNLASEAIARYPDCVAQLLKLWQGSQQDWLKA